MAHHHGKDVQTVDSGQHNTRERGCVKRLSGPASEECAALPSRDGHMPPGAA
jgi:hypothetical protein